MHGVWFNAGSKAEAAATWLILAASAEHAPRRMRGQLQNRAKLLTVPMTQYAYDPQAGAADCIGPGQQVVTSWLPVRKLLLRYGLDMPAPRRRRACYSFSRQDNRAEQQGHSS